MKRDQDGWSMREEMELASRTIAQTIAAEAAARGEARGEARGAERAMREALETVLTERCGALPPEIKRELATADMEALRTWLRLAAKATSFGDVGILSSKSPR